MRFFISFLSVAVFLGLPASVSAGEPIACGVPESVGVATEAQDYCNLHQRRFAYREEREKLRQQIDERRENYYAPQNSALKAYDAELETLNEGRGGTAANTNESAGELGLSPE